MEEAAEVYRAYLMRLWIMDNDGCPQWRLSLEEAHGEYTVHFTGFTEFLVFLIGQTENKDPGEER